jgi:hypothetical protein
MTFAELTRYLEIGLAFAAVMAPTVGAIGHACAALPWTWAKTLGNVLNAISVDFGDLKNALQNAKLGAAANVAGALKSGALVPIGDDRFQAPPGTEKKIASVAPPPAGLGLMCIAWLAFGAAASLTTVSCSSPPKDPTTLGATARKDAQLGYAIAVVSLTALDNIQSAWLNGLEHPTDDQLTASAKVVAALKLTRDSLEAARPWIQDGTGDKGAAQKAMLDGIDAATLAAELLAQLGGKVPDVVLDALDAAHAALGGGK